MRRSSTSRCGKCRAILIALILLCLSLFAAAQVRKPDPARSASPAKPQKPAATTTTRPPAQQSPAGGSKRAQALGAVREDEDYLKEREEWFLGDRTLPDGSVATGLRQRALKHVDQMIEVQRKMGLLPAENAAPLATDFPGPAAWTLIGPQPINVGSSGFFPFNGGPSNSGRVTALAVDPKDPNVVFLGAAAGGVWRTPDGGLHWTPMTDNQPSLSIGSLAIDPTSSSTIYVGTGEQNFSGDSYYGAGVLKSIDGGATWMQQGVGVFTGPLGAPFGASRLDGGAHIGAIAVDPFKNQIVLAGVSRFSSPAASGIYRTTDGGSNWAGPLAMGGATGGAAGTEIVFDPVNSGVVYAALGNAVGATVNGVYRSTDDGANWTKIGSAPASANPFPTANVGRIAIDLARSAPDTLFALVAKADGTGQLGLWKTSNANSGASADWIQLLTTTPDFCTSTGGSQCFYDLVIRVHPQNPNVVFAGGSTGDFDNGRALWRSTNGGANWFSVAPGATTSLHVDLHALAFSANGGRLYIGNDGGAWRFDSPTGRVDFIDLNPTLAITMSYPGHGVHFSDENIMFVGSQDNGTQRYSGAPAWDLVTPGDGGQAAIDPNAPSAVYTTCQFVCIFRSITDGTSVLNYAFKTKGIVSTDRTRFIAPLTQDPSNAGRVYFGTFRVYLTTDFAENWTPISPDLTGGTGVLNAIAVSRRNPNTVYVGAGTGQSIATSFPGKVWKSINALQNSGVTWTDITGVNQLPPRNITAVAVDPNDPTANIAYATFSGFSGFGGDTKGHVFRTADGGANWQDVSGTGTTALPNVPVNDILLDDLIPNAAYVATDVGVFRTADATQGVWTPVVGLPRVVVLSLNARSKSRIVRASTSGRGTWIIQDTNVAIPAGPFLSSIRPTSVQAGSTTAVTLTAVDGANFTSTSRVQWDGSQTGVTTTFVSANKLTATLDPSLFMAANVGVHQITVVEPGPPPVSSDFLRFSVLGAAPTITSLLPNTTSAGGPSFNLQVNGTGFNCSTTPGVGSTVSFRGVSHTPLASPPCSPNQMMTVAIGASEIAVGGNGNVAVFTPPPGGGNSSPFSFPITAPPPANDNFAQAINGSPTPFSDTKDSSGATTEPGEPAPGCTAGQSPQTKSIWYTFTPAGNGTVTADTNGTTYDSVLQAVTGTLGNFTSVACADLNGPGVGETVSFTVTAGVHYFFVISDFNGVGGATVFHLTASTTGGPAPAASFNPTNVPFGSQKVGTTAGTTNMQITNSGTATLNITSITKTGANPGDFNLVAPTAGTPTCPTGPSTLAPQSSCFLGVNFAPTAAGARAANVSVNDNVPGSPQTVPLSGNGTAPAVTLAPASTAFSQNVGTTSTATNVQLTNTGTAALNIAGITLTGANVGEFALVAPTGGATPACSFGASSINAGSSCFFGVNFTPASTGAKSASVSIGDDAANSPQTVPLTGTGTTPGVALSSTNVAFGNVNMGDSKAAAPAVTLTNSGTGPLTITAINITGTDAAQFTQTNTCGALPATIAANGTCTITPSFRPTSTGPKNNASLSIADNAATSPQAVPLTGIGVDFSISGPPTAVTVAAGQPANFTINLTGGPTTNTITFSATGNPAATSVTFNPASIPAGSTTGITTMTITTTARSAGSAPPQRGPANPQTPLVLPLSVVTAALALMSLSMTRQGSRAKPYAACLLLTLFLASAAFILGCGGGGKPSGTPPGTSTITVTATSGSVSRAATVTLTVN